MIDNDFFLKKKSLTAIRLISDRTVNDKPDNFNSGSLFNYYMYIIVLLDRNILRFSLILFNFGPNFNRTKSINLRKIKNLFNFFYLDDLFYFRRF